MTQHAGVQAPPGSGADGVRDIVSVRLPADGAYLSVLRSVTAALAARLDFTLDDIGDLRVAVDEACASRLAHASSTAIRRSPMSSRVTSRRAASAAVTLRNTDR